MGQKSGMRGATLGIVLSRFFQAEAAVHRQPDIGCVAIFLPVILPPADRAQRQRAGRFQRSVPAARAAKTIPHSSPLLM